MKGSEVTASDKPNRCKGATVTPSLEYRRIPLTQGQFALVDLEDWPRLSGYRWFAHWMNRPGSFYAHTHPTELPNGRNITFSMHRIIMGLERGDTRMVDHINHDTLDNRKQNLRVVTNALNQFNLRLRSDNRSGVTGVCLHKGSGKYIVRVGQRHLGCYEDFNVAVQIRRDAVAKILADAAGEERGGE
jgi:HNH endonuclease